MSDLVGWSSDMSEEGLHLAVGSILNDGGGKNAGRVRGYCRVKEEEEWVQEGVEMDGDDAQDYYARSMARSEDGDRVVCGAV